MGGDISSQVEICIEKCMGKVNRQIQSRAARVSNVLRSAELKVLSGQRSGKVYRKPHSKSTYTASAPGEAPARRTGDLRLSFVPYTDSLQEGKGYILRAGIKSGLKYAEELERGNGHMARRPYRDPIIERAKPEVERIFSEPFRL